MRLLPSFAILATATVSANAAVLVSDGFSYSNGGLVANSGGNWTNLSGTGTLLQVASGEVANLTHGSGSREDATRIFSATNITTGSVFAKFDLTVNTAPTAGSDYFAALHPIASSDFRGRTYLAAPSVASAGAYRIGFDNDSTASLFTSDLTSPTISIVIGVNAATNQSKLWVGTNIGSFVEASPTLSDTNAVTTVVGLARSVLRQGTGISVANSVDIDNLVIGNTFASVVPEPASLGLLGLASLVGLRRRSR